MNYIDDRQLIQAYFEVSPYLALDWRFDAKAMLSEVIPLLDKFRPHRGVSGWSSLALQALGGDACNTESEASYGCPRAQCEDFLLTPHARECPSTIRCLTNHFSLERCRRVRFMLLSAGSSIPYHRDTDEPVAIVTHLPLNYRSECRFTIDLLSDGSTWSSTRKIPFVNDRPMLVNVGAYHCVYNDSPSDRIAIIVEGMPFLKTPQLLALARRQHPIADEQLAYCVLARRLALVKAERAISNQSY